MPKADTERSIEESFPPSVMAFLNTSHYPALSYLTACSDWNGNHSCVCRGEDEDDWCDECRLRVRELPRIIAAIRRETIERCAAVCEEYADEARALADKSESDVRFYDCSSGAHECAHRLRALKPEGGDK